MPIEALLGLKLFKNTKMFWRFSMAIVILWENTTASIMPLKQKQTLPAHELFS